MEPNKPSDPGPDASVPPSGDVPPALAGTEAAPLVVGGPAVEPIPPAAATEAPPAAIAAEPAAEPAPPPAAETAPPAAEASPADREQNLLALETARGKLIALLCADAKPKPADLTAEATAYAAALQESPNLLAEEWERFRAAVLAESATGHVAEVEKLRSDTERQLTAYTAMFAGLPALEASITAEIDRMKDDDAGLTAAPAEVKDTLGNYKKGLQIIQRMFGRLHARKKPLEGIAAQPPAPTLGEAPQPAECAAQLTQFAEAFSAWRTAGATALRDVRKKADSVRKEVAGFVSALLGPIDGIEAGLRNEPELLGRMESFRGEHAAVIDTWTKAYERLDAALKPYFEATGLTPILVEPGTQFKPETMEPGGTVLRPDLPVEQVLSVMRRGYALHGEQLRPVQVEVAVHTATES